MLFLEICILALLVCGTLPMLFTSIKRLYIPYAVITGILLVILLHTQTQIDTIKSFVFGNFQPKIGIEHNMTTISYFFITLISTISIYTMYVLQTSIKASLKYLILFFTTTIVSMLVVVLSNDIFNFYVFFELYGICIYLLFAIGTNIQQKKYVLEYIIFGGIASVFIVLGIEILYVLHHTLNISTINTDSLEGSRLVLTKIAMLFIIISTFIKVGIFPFNGWVRKIYTACPNFFLPFYGSLATSLALYLLVFFEYFIVKSYDLILFTSNIVTPFCIGTMAIFSFLAIKEKDMRIMFAYSTLVQASYVIICLATPNISAINGGILHIVHNIICKFGLFAIISQVFIYKKHYNISAVNGLFTSNKIVSICFCVLVFSMIGFPLTSGFVTKFYMFQGLIEEKRFYVLAFFVLGTVLSLAYLWQIVQSIFFEQSIATAQSIQIGKFHTTIISITAMASILFGIFPKITLEKSQTLVTIFLQNLS